MLKGGGGGGLRKDKPLTVETNYEYGSHVNVQMKRMS